MIPTNCLNRPGQAHMAIGSRYPLCCGGMVTISRWSEWGGSNSRPRDPKSRALPTALHPDMEQHAGLEPAPSVWKTNVLTVKHQCCIEFPA